MIVLSLLLCICSNICAMDGLFDADGFKESMKQRDYDEAAKKIEAYGKFNLKSPMSFEELDAYDPQSIADWNSPSAKKVAHRIEAWKRSLYPEALNKESSNFQKAPKVKAKQQIGWFSLKKTAGGIIVLAIVGFSGYRFFKKNYSLER